VTPIETEIVSFDAVFIPHMLTNDSRPLIECLGDLLPQPGTNFVALPVKGDAA
jgi:hypothetical protein